MHRLMFVFGITVTAALMGCAEGPPKGVEVANDKGPCEMPGNIVVNKGGVSACVDTDLELWRRLSVSYVTHDPNSRTAYHGTRDFWVPPGGKCASMPPGLTPEAVNGCERFGARL